MALSTPAHLDTAQMCEIIGGINTELKCALIGSLPFGQARSADEVFDSIQAHDGFSLTNPPYKPNKIRRDLGRMPDLLRDVAVDPEDETHWFTKNRVGHFATAMAGGLATISQATNIPTRKLTSERLVKESPDGQVVDAIQNRLNVLYVLTVATTPANRWVPIGKLNEAALELGSTNRSVHVNLGSLVKGGIVAVKESQRGRKFRFAAGDDCTRPEEAVASYLEMFAKFACGDSDAIEQGHTQIMDILDNNKVLPYIIQRSFASTGHSGKR